jgi:hypothetical protein
MKFYICSYFLAQVWLFGLLQCFNAEIDEPKFCSVSNYCIPSCIPHLQSHKQIFVERALPRQSSMTTHVFRLGLTLLPTTMFCWCHWGRKFQSIWNYYIPSCIHNLHSHKQIFVERALPHWSSASNHGFFFFFCCWTGIKLTVRVTSKKANAPCTEG